MDKLNQWVALTLVGVLAVLAAGWFLLVGPKRTEAAELRAEALAQRAATDTLRVELEVLKAQARDLPREQARLARVTTKVPEARAMPSLVRTLTEAAERAGVQLEQLSPAASQPFAGGGTEAPAPEAGGLSAVPVQLAVGGGFYETQRFLDALENMPRAFKVLEVVLTPGADPSKVAAQAAAGGGESSAAGGATVETGNFLKTTINGSVYTLTRKPALVPTPGAAAPSNAKAQ